MRTLASFQNIHQGETIIVCGCGESLNNLVNSKQFVTIGVNDVGRRFHPNYLVVLNPRQQFSGDRFHYVENSQAEYLFTQLELGVSHPNVVKFRLGTYGGTDFSDPNVLHYTQNSPYVALCLAVYMGAKRIGLIGVDFTENHFFARTGVHPLNRQLAVIDDQYRRLGNALGSLDVEVFNLSPFSRLTAFPKMPLEEFMAAEPIVPTCKSDSPLNIVSYATTPVAGVPAILARCISKCTPHACRCVWAQNGYGNGVKFDGDIQWIESPTEAESSLIGADVVIVHNGKIEPQHRSLIQNKAIITMAHNYAWNVDQAFIKQGFPGAVVGQYQATLPEFKDWSIVPNPIPLWEEAFKPGRKDNTMTICYTPFGKHERYPTDHRLYWHSKGYDTTMRVLDRLSARFPLRLEVIRDRQVSHTESLAMKQRAHIVIDECVTGSYHRNSLEGLAAGCVVVNGMGLLPAVAEVFRHCTGVSHIPFVYANLDELESILVPLIQRGADALTEEGALNHEWMEQYWDFSSQWRKFWMPIITQSLQIVGYVKHSTQKDSAQITPPVTLQNTVRSNPVQQSQAVVSVIIPHGGQERLPLLSATLAGLRQCQGVGEIIVVEMDEMPSAEKAIRQQADKYVFVNKTGLFNRARALNVGIPFAEHELILWLDNDLIVPSNFLNKAIAELRSRQLDCLIPWTSICYLSSQDSNEIINGSRQGLECTPVKTYTSRQACGACVLIRKTFIQQYGGMCEEFQGWGGEDNAWFYKARLLGRAAVTEHNDQHLYHLYHDNSGGYDSQNHIAKNPRYNDNVALLKTIKSIRDPGQYIQRFPPPNNFSCPWELHKRIAFIGDDTKASPNQVIKPIAHAFADLYGIAIDLCIYKGDDTMWREEWSMQEPDALVFFGTAIALRFLANTTYKSLRNRVLVVHNEVITNLTADAINVLKLAGGHLNLETPIDQISVTAGLHTWQWSNTIDDTNSVTLAALALAQPLSIILSGRCANQLSEEIMSQSKANSKSLQDYPMYIPEKYGDSWQEKKKEDYKGSVALIEKPAQQSSRPAECNPAIGFVSCILATCNRPAFVRQAIRCFLRQTYDQSELIIVDDGNHSVADLCSGLYRVRHIRLNEPTLLGSKLNIGIKYARGSIIQKLDDDDYYHPDFLKHAVENLPPVGRGHPLVVWDCFLIFLVGEKCIHYSGHGWAAGGTLCFHRELWEQKHFRDIPCAVDHWFIKDHRPNIIKVCLPELYIVVRHGHNTWNKIGDKSVDESFQQRPIYHKSLGDLIEPIDRIFYDSLIKGELK